MVDDDPLSQDDGRLVVATQRYRNRPWSAALRAIWDRYPGAAALWAEGETRPRLSAHTARVRHMRPTRSRP